MDLFDLTDEPEFSADEERAIHLSRIATSFSNASSSLSTAEVRQEFYPERSSDAAEKAFQRDRHALALSGVFIERIEDESGDVAWRLDERSLALENVLSSSDALVMSLICRQFLNDPSFPYTDELQMALAKIDRSFDGVLPHIKAEALTPSRELLVLREAHEKQCAVAVDYTNVDGESSHKILAVYGFFSLLHSLYLVGVELNRSGEILDAPRTYRLDRFGSAELVDDLSYEVPQDFFVDDYRMLPFQIGEESYSATFFVPKSEFKACKAESLSKGSWEEQVDGFVWTVDVADTYRAATWAIAHGIRPSSPSQLVREWTRVLKEVSQLGS